MSVLRHILALCAILFWGLGSASAQAQPVPGGLRVQLSWVDQAEFAGFYVADRMGYFHDEGLTVTTLPGGPGIAPLDSLRTGAADIAVSHLVASRLRSDRGETLVNIAQIFSRSSLMLICRRSDGINRLRDVVGKTVGVAHWGDEEIVTQMLVRAGGGGGKAVFVSRGGDGAELRAHRASCISGVSYNEYRKVLEGGTSASDLSIFRPADVGIRTPEDGLYVLSSRLNDPVFVDRLAHFVVALKRGWDMARERPAWAVALTTQKNPALNEMDQARMLEAVLPLVGRRDFGYFPIVDENGLNLNKIIDFRDDMWTHLVWNQVEKLEKIGGMFNISSIYYAERAQGEWWFNIILLIGFASFGAAAVIDAMNSGYDFWGCLMIALIGVMGGGILRDLILARGRLPFTFLTDPSVPAMLTALCVVLAIFKARVPHFDSTPFWLAVRRYSEAIGFGIISVYGAVVCILAGTPWFWVPASAAMTVAGGGIMRDIVMNREPRNFRGNIFEELAVLSGVLIVLGFVVAENFEQSPLAVQLVLAFDAILIAVMRFFIAKHDVSYPKILGYLSMRGRSGGLRPPTS